MITISEILTNYNKISYASITIMYYNGVRFSFETMGKESDIEEKVAELTESVAGKKEVSFGAIIKDIFDRSKSRTIIRVDNEISPIITVGVKYIDM